MIDYDLSRRLIKDEKVIYLFRCLSERIIFLVYNDNMIVIGQHELYFPIRASEKKKNYFIHIN
jgi:hypothetical protein